MNDESLEQIERRIASRPLPGAPPALRKAVLANVKRELRAARWDRRLGRAAAVLLVVGVGWNAAIGLQSLPAAGRQPAQVAGGRSPQSLAETAALVAVATDAETGRRFARHFVAMSGRKLSADEAAAIDAAIEHRHTRVVTNGGDG